MSAHRPEPAPQHPIESQRFFRGSVNYSWWLLPAFVLGLCAWVALLKAVL